MLLVQLMQPLLAGVGRRGGMASGSTAAGSISSVAETQTAAAETGRALRRASLNKEQYNQRGADHKERYRDSRDRGRVGVMSGGPQRQGEGSGSGFRVPAAG
jgi:hypothetical protein